MQDVLPRRIRKIDMLQNDVASQRSIGDAGTVGMRMLPGPMACVFLRFRYGSVVCDFRVDQGDITVILFRRLIHQRENPTCAGHGHDDGIDLL